MRSSIAALSIGATLAAAAPYNPFPLPDGFPSPNATGLASIQAAAGGSLPNGALPTSLSAAGTLTLQVIAANELFEVAYFTQLLHNITSGVSGYEDGDTDYVKKTFTQIRAQEELHAIGANAILQTAGQTPIQPCNYTFPVTSYAAAVNLANVFTDVVLSVLPLAQTQFASDAGQEAGLVQLIGSIMSQEGQQDGWFRSVAGKVPSAAPFLTTTNAAFAVSALASFLVPGSCPNLNLVTDTVAPFMPLTVVSGQDYSMSGANSTVTYMVPGAIDPSMHSIAYLSGQNKPVVVSISNVTSSGSGNTFTASLPFAEGFANGLSIAAVVNGTSSTSFADGAAVAAATIYGPGLIEIN